MSTEGSERIVLATLLHRPDFAAKVFTRVPVGEFTGPHMLVAEAIHHLRVGHKPIDITTVMDEMTRRGTLTRIPGGGDGIRRLSEWFVSASSLDYHLDALADGVRLRQLRTLGDRLSHLTGMEDADGSALAQETAEKVQGILDQITAEQDVPTETLGDLLDSQDEPYDWVIPGLLERADRLMLTGTEGLGKTTLFRQIAVCAAAGLHPFTHRPIEPVRVLYLDLENTRKQARRSLAPMAMAARQAGAEGDPRNNMFIECRPQGIDVTKPEDELWFVQRVVALQPAILFTGPIYKMHEQDPNEEKPARKIAAVLDRARAAANCAIVTETHVGHSTEGITGPRKVRPIGTSMWLRWPEFGYGIRPTDEFNPDTRVVDFVPWRGDREERDWPQRLRKGGAWPWAVATDPNSQWSPGIERGA